MMKKLATALCYLMVVNGCDTNAPPDYEYRTITIESSYTNWHVDKSKAEEKAHAELSGYAKGVCRRAIRPDWSLSDIEYEGELKCELSSDGHHCRKKGVVLVCRRVSEFFP